MCAPVEAKVEVPPAAPPGSPTPRHAPRPVVDDAPTDDPGRRYVLTLVGPQGAHRFEIVGATIDIGRAEPCDIAISHPSVDPIHVSVTPSPSAVRYTVRGQSGLRWCGDVIRGELVVDLDIEVGLGTAFTISVGRERRD